MNERIKFTTPDTALKELAANGTDKESSREIVEIASIIMAVTKNVMIEVSHEKSGLLHGEAWFCMKNTNEKERFNNATAYKILVNRINPGIKVGANLWPDNDTGTHIDGVHYDVIDVNLFGNGGNGEQDIKYAREQAELWLNEATERMKQAGNPAADENTPVNPMRTMNLWSTNDDDDDGDDPIEIWANERYSFGEDE